MTNLQKGLVGHWTMDDADTSGSVLYDRSAYDNHGSITGATQTSGIFGGAYDFDGSGDYVTVPDTTVFDSNEITVSVWANLNEVKSVYSGIVDTNYQPFAWYQDTGNQEVNWYLEIGGSNVSLRDIDVPLNGWVHLVGLYDDAAGESRAYRDGVQVRSTSATGSLNSGTSDMYIGRRDSGNEDWNGQIQSVRVYDRALSESEISALYNMRSQRQVNANSAHTEDLLLHLNARVDRSVDEANNRWYDISGNNHEAHGTDGEGSIVDSFFPNWEPTNGGRFVLNGAEGWNIPGPIETTGQVSFESWFYKDDLTNDNEYLADARNGTGDWQLTNYGNQNISFHNDLVADDPETHQPDSNWWDRWTHLVATSDGTTSQLFIDGEQITDSRLKSSNGFPTGVGQDFAIANRFTGRAYLEGYMSVYRIYDTILSPAQVSANYNAEKMFYK